MATTTGRSARRRIVRGRMAVRRTRRWGAGRRTGCSAARAPSMTTIPPDSATSPPAISATAPFPVTSLMVGAPEPRIRPERRRRSSIFAVSNAGVAGRMRPSRRMVDVLRARGSSAILSVSAGGVGAARACDRLADGPLRDADLGSAPKALPVCVAGPWSSTVDRPKGFLNEAAASCGDAHQRGLPT